MSKNKKLAGEFKQFIAKGNVVDLAVAVVIGAAFNRIVSQIVDSFITPLLGLVLRGLSLAEWKWVVKDAVLNEAGEVLETSMDDIELDIVLEYYQRNRKYMEE